MYIIPLLKITLFSEEVVALKEKLKQIGLEKSDLIGEQRAWERERREISVCILIFFSICSEMLRIFIYCFPKILTLQYELERVRNEVSVLEQSKKWLMDEVTERDNRISKLRIDLVRFYFIFNFSG